MQRGSTKLLWQPFNWLPLKQIPIWISRRITAASSLPITDMVRSWNSVQLQPRPPPNPSSCITGRHTTPIAPFIAS